MKVDCVVKGGRVVTPMGVIMGGVAISGGSIAAVGQDGLLPEGHRVIDAAGKFVIPGFIDMHSHLGAGGPIARIETDFISETEAAAHGGVTSFRSMVASMEPYLPQIDEIIGWGEKNSLVDFSFHAAIEVDEHFEELDALCDKGISGFKMFYTAYKGEEGRKLGQLGCDDGMVLRGCEFLARRGHPALITFHCEEQDIMDLLQPRVQGEGRGDLPAWTDARPDFIEPMSIDSAAWIAQATGARIHIAHVSTAEGAERIAYWKGRGVQIFGETCPHYLVLTKHEEGLVPWGKINPPLRDAEDNARLWAALREGTIETMGTDNCPYTRAEKEQGGDLWSALPGYANGWESWLPLMMTEGVLKGRLTIEQMVRVCSEGTARLMGTYPRKGALIPGADADLVIVDPEREGVIRGENLHSRAKEWCVYEGRKVRGLPVLTMVRGEVVMEEGETVGRHGHGRFVPCGP